MSNTKLIAIATFIIIVFVVLIKENLGDSEQTLIKENSVVLAFGDSLTYGFGVDKEFSYPSQLEKKTTLKVINAGISGEISSDGLRRLPYLLSKYKPDLVILCHGGNDILRKLSDNDLKRNLLEMVKLIKQSKAEILLVGVPDFGLLTFDTHEVYQEVADEMDLLFEDDILRHIEINRALKSDYVHPNEKGYEMMADKFIEVLDIKLVR